MPSGYCVKVCVWGCMSEEAWVAQVNEYQLRLLSNACKREPSGASLLAVMGGRRVGQV
jgi:hypothetical protein